MGLEDWHQSTFFNQRGSNRLQELPYSLSFACHIECHINIVNDYARRKILDDLPVPDTQIRHRKLPRGNEPVVDKRVLLQVTGIARNTTPLQIFRRGEECVVQGRRQSPGHHIFADTVPKAESNLYARTDEVDFRISERRNSAPIVFRRSIKPADLLQSQPAASRGGAPDNRSGRNAGSIDCPRRPRYRAPTSAE